MRRAGVALALALLLPSCAGVPRLTEARVVEDLGDDDLEVVFWAFSDDCVASAIASCPSGPERSYDDEVTAAATRAGWLTRLCPSRPEIVAVGDRRWTATTRWHRQPHDPGGCEMERWSVLVARYARTGPPTVAADVEPNARIVTIPGRWRPNAAGRALFDAGYTPLGVVDRRERYTYFEGVWARRHIGR